MTADVSVLETAGRIAGLGGLALGVFLLLFKDLLRKLKVPGLRADQWFKVIITFMVLVWSTAIGGMGAWVYAEARSGQEERPARRVPFVASNEDTPFAVKGRFEGDAVVEARRVVVRLKRGLLSYPEEPPAGGDASIESIRVSLAESFKDAWRPVSVSDAVRISRVLVVGSKLELADMKWEFAVPPDGLAGRWLVFEIADPQGNTCIAQTPSVLF